jgi:precorrin-2 dehydrogenase/sirohydrochlorin ferrochelatase
MSYLVNLDVRERSALVVGAGPIAARKIAALLEAGARVTVVSPEVAPPLAALADTHEIVHHARPYREGDLAGATLAYVACGDTAVQAAVAAEGARSGVLVNVVDVPERCTFIAPAVVRRGPVVVAVSTGGASPALARRLRQELETHVGPEYGVAATILARLRPLLREGEPDAEARARAYARLVDGPLLDAVRAGDAAGVDAILRDVVGAGASLAALGVSLP